MNNDTFADIVIGAPGAHDMTGLVYIVYGSPTPRTSALDLTTELTHTDGFIIHGTLQQDVLGVSVGNAGK